MIKLNVFAGLKPAIETKNVRGQFGQIAHNTRLTDTSIRPFRAPMQVVADYHIGDTDEIVQVHEFRSSNCCRVVTFDKCVSIIEDMQSPGSCPGFDYAVVFPRPCGSSCPPAYWLDKCTGDTWPLVIDAPIKTPLPTLTQSGEMRDAVCGGEGCNPYRGPDERAYTYTWVDHFGVESAPAAPSRPVLAFDDETWTITNFSAPPVGARCLRIYRTGSFFEDDGENPEVTFASSFQLVEELALVLDSAGIPLPVPSYVDNSRACDMTYGTLLTEQNCPPPCMCEVVTTESGYVVGFSGDQVYMSERHEPWNFPEKYRVTLPAKIVGIAAFFDFVFVGTVGKPYRINTAFAARGNEADATIDPAPYEENYPCLSSDSMVTTAFGAIYASHQGLVGLAPSGPAELISRGRISETDFYAKWAPNVATYRNGKYFGARSPAGGGFIFDVVDKPEGALDFGDLVTIDWHPSQATTSQSGRLLYIEDGAAWGWDEGTEPMTYRWRSKRMHFEGWRHLSAVKLCAEFGPPITVRFYGDGRLLDEFDIEDEYPHRIRRAGRAIKFEVEVEGTTPLIALDAAQSITELIEGDA